MKKLIAFLLTVVFAVPFMCYKSNNKEKDVVQQEKVEYFEGASQISETNEMQILADNTIVTSYDTFLEAYYRGLTQNFGHNYQKSCGYVALGMLLSYYDTYLDDDIIPEHYDVASTSINTITPVTNMIERNNSPGILYDDFSNKALEKYGNDDVDKLTAEQFLEVAKCYRYSSLYAYLICLASETCIDEDFIYKKGNADGSAGLTSADQREVLLEAYIENQRFDYNKDVEITRMSGSQYSQQEYKQFIKDNIDKGNPVLVSIYSGSENTDIGHAMICYDYSGSIIYGHTGYLGEEHVDVSTVLPGVELYRDATVIEFLDTSKPTEDSYEQWEHNHALNYKVRPVLGAQLQDMCYCNSNILTYTTRYRQYQSIVPNETSFTIPSWVTEICDYAFVGQTNLVEITVQMANSNLTVIGNHAFDGCSSLEEIYLSDGVVFIGANAFVNCISLATVRVKASLPSPIIINSSSSQLEPNFEIVPPTFLLKNELPESLETIGEGAFINCVSLENIKIDINVSSIGNFAFAGCTSLVEATFEDVDSWIIENGTVINSQLLSNKTSAAQCLLNYSDFMWLKI